LTLLLATVTGFLAGRLLWLLLRPVFAVPALHRPNYRGHQVVTAAGLVLPLALVLVEGGRVVAASAGLGGRAELGEADLMVAATALGLALLGLLDDLVGPGGVRGFRGHLGALVRGGLTTGGVKLVGGLAVAAVAVAPRSGTSVGRLLADAALVALTANLANLFDRGPGRAGKVGLACFLVLAVATAATTILLAVAVVAGAAAALLLDDLNERLMLGDAGANALGGVLGIGVVLACSPAIRTAVLVVVAALNLVSEVVSFSRVIDAVPPLRALDRAGRRYP
jgi:hypothetical protein